MGITFHKNAQRFTACRNTTLLMEPRGFCSGSQESVLKIKGLKILVVFMSINRDSCIF